MEDWLFDSVVEFMQSPAWTTPVLTFIDENCSKFDDGDANKPVYTELHNVGTLC